MPFEAARTVRRVWRGACRPAWPLPADRRWYHHVEYWPRRFKEIVGALFIVAGPPWIAFLVYVMYAKNPGATLALAANMSALWLFLVVVAYYAGRDRS